MPQYQILIQEEHKFQRLRTKVWLFQRQSQCTSLKLQRGTAENREQEKNPAPLPSLTSIRETQQLSMRIKAYYKHK